MPWTHSHSPSLTFVRREQRLVCSDLASSTTRSGGVSLRWYSITPWRYAALHKRTSSASSVPIMPSNAPSWPPKASYAARPRLCARGWQDDPTCASDSMRDERRVSALLGPVRPARSSGEDDCGSSGGSSRSPRRSRSVRDPLSVSRNPYDTAPRPAAPSAGPRDGERARAKAPTAHPPAAAPAAKAAPIRRRTRGRDGGTKPT
mmetsp:Transcript_28253/g.67317  ORF Transcript_28253/g.67317 Transcript_28253/m.67317 type:complete len:204 (-) Transcript_28253:238-849(-)